MRIPLVDLKAQHDAIGDEIQSAMAAVIRESSFIGGPAVKRFEEEFASFCGTRHAVGVSSGTDALRLAMLACGVKPGDEVVTVPNTFIATAEAIHAIGAKVRLVDVEPNHGNMDAGLLEASITERTRALIPVHLYGRPTDMDPVCRIAKRKGLKVIADAAQAHGALYKGRPVATIGDAACFSFYPGKNLGAFGDAGAVATNDPRVAEQVSLLRDHGRREKYEHEIPGFNCRLDSLQASILSVKLRHLRGWNRRRVELAALYNRILENIPGLTSPTIDGDMASVFHLYVIRTESRSSIREQLQERGIACGIHYPVPLHRQPAFAHLGHGEGSFPVAEGWCRRVLSLPIYPELREEQVQEIAAAVRSHLEEGGPP